MKKRFSTESITASFSHVWELQLFLYLSRYAFAVEMHCLCGAKCIVLQVEHILQGVSPVPSFLSGLKLTSGLGTCDPELNPEKS